MNNTLTLRQIGDVKILLEALKPRCFDWSWDTDGTAKAAVKAGALIAFDAKVSVQHKGVEIGAAYLGDCIYESLEDFRTSDFIVNGKTAAFPGAQSHVRDMMHEALSAARDRLPR